MASSDIDLHEEQESNAFPNKDTAPYDRTVLASPFSDVTVSTPPLSRSSSRDLTSSSFSSIASIGMVSLCLSDDSTASPKMRRRTNSTSDIEELPDGQDAYPNTDDLRFFEQMLQGMEPNNVQRHHINERIQRMIDNNSLPTVRMFDDFLDNEPADRPLPTYPVGDEKYTECSVCLESKTLSLRPCCSLAVCSDCVKQYFVTQVSEGIVKIECPNFVCDTYIHRDEITFHLETEMKDKFHKFLVNANKEAHIKTCPRCSEIMELEKHKLEDKSKIKVHKGIPVTCKECALCWCFLCQAPWHTDLSCKGYRKGERLLKSWAKEQHFGQRNAQQCPRCNIFIQRSMGCDHMTCSKCKTDFCYLCGDRFRAFKFLGDHYTKLSIFGCKYRFMPTKPAMRKFIRGSLLGGMILAAPAVVGLVLGAGAVLAGVAVVAAPFIGSYKLHKKLKEKKRIKQQRKNREIMREMFHAIKKKNYSMGYVDELDISNPPTGIYDLELQNSYLDTSQENISRQEVVSADVYTLNNLFDDSSHDEEVKVINEGQGQTDEAKMRRKGKDNENGSKRRKKSNESVKHEGKTCKDNDLKIDSENKKTHKSNKQDQDNNGSGIKPNLSGAEGDETSSNDAVGDWKDAIGKKGEDHINKHETSSTGAVCDRKDTAIDKKGEDSTHKHEKGDLNMLELLMDSDLGADNSKHELDTHIENADTFDKLHAHFKNIVKDLDSETRVEETHIPTVSESTSL
ncbi:unnamed protein product [Owenia fusiformis]|uniref:RBR-type E3 ubiquitin transferase n=1 Tax=Owenia fusiformis TaxID=6347 RepID=A0A8J1Y9L9_OWEFU|nr:unnamed protein product [Owenia fusiformis]